MKINREAVENSRLANFLKKYWIPILAVIVVITVIASSVGIYREEVLHIDPDVQYEEGDKLYMKAVRKLYLGSKDPVELMVWREIFDRLEKCCDACEDVANVVESVIMKNS